MATVYLLSVAVAVVVLVVALRRHPAPPPPPLPPAPTAPAVELRDRHSNWWGQLEPIDDHTSEYRTGDDSLEWLAMRICMLGVEFEVHEPPELVDALAALQARIGRATARTR